MSEQKPIPVADALKALRMLREAWKMTTPAYPYLPSSAPDQVFNDAARAVLPGMVEYLIAWLEHNCNHGDRFHTTSHIHQAIAPIVAWARTREEWSR